jgi:hypothetical protein
MDRRDAEAQLDRELDESANRERVEAPRSRHRVFYALPVVVVVSAIGGGVAYLITTLLVESGVVWSCTIAAAMILAIAWGTTGISRAQTTAGDRVTDVAVCLLVGSLVIGVVRPAPIWNLFAESHGLGDVFRLHERFAWSAAWACASVALCSLVRLGSRR